jgi:enoyl-CoA hydratase
VTVLSHAPEVFCAGADREDIAAGRIGDLVTARGGFAGLVARNRIKPLIAAVDGPAEAGGCEIALACDLVVGSAAASFVLPEAALGKVAAAGGAFRLPRLLPQRVALYALLSGDGISAEVAHRFGLINDLVAMGEAEVAALAMAERICRSGPLAVRETLALVRRAVFADEASLWQMSREALNRTVQTADAREGTAAYNEQRSPEWRAR